MEPHAIIAPAINDSFFVMSLFLSMWVVMAMCEIQRILNGESLFLFCNVCFFQFPRPSFGNSNRYPTP